MADEMLKKVIGEVCEVFGVKSMRKEQYDIIKSLLCKKDCLAVLPTGYGKSLPYQIYVPLIRRLKFVENYDDYLNSDTRDMLSKIDTDEKVLVCSPLLSLMDDQVRRLRQIPNLRAAYKGSSPEADEQIKQGAVDVIFASPETLVGDTVWRLKIQQLTVGVIVIDEFHTITTWGGDEDTEEHEAFRKWFRYVGELRAMFPSATILALSATCTNKIRKHVTKILSMRPESTTFISISPNKSNIKLVVKKVDNNIETAMFWLVDSLETLKSDFPKTLIYCNSISDVSKLYSYIVSELSSCTEHIEMFHSETPEHKKKLIIEKVCDVTSNLRIVIATTALGMGIDVTGCHCIILFGPPRSVLDLVQEIGRVGRDNQKSVAILMYNSYHLRHVNKEVKQIFGDKCRRQMIMNNFLSELEMNNLEAECNKHTCCDVCSLKCSCGHCEQISIERMVENISCDRSDSDSEIVSYEQEWDSQDSDSQTLSYKYEQVHREESDDEFYADFEQLCR